MPTDPTLLKRGRSCAAVHRSGVLCEMGPNHWPGPHRNFARGGPSKTVTWEDDAALAQPTQRCGKCDRLLKYRECLVQGDDAGGHCEPTAQPTQETCEHAREDELGEVSVWQCLGCKRVRFGWAECVQGAIDPPPKHLWALLAAQPQPTQETPEDAHESDCALFNDPERGECDCRVKVVAEYLAAQPTQETPAGEPSDRALRMQWRARQVKLTDVPKPSESAERIAARLCSHHVGLSPRANQTLHRPRLARGEVARVPIPHPHQAR